MLGTSKNIWGFEPRSIPNCQIWLDASDQATMNSTTTVTVWNDKSGNSNNMTGTATLSGSNMTFNGTNQAFSNTTYAFPFGAYSMFAVYSNTTAPTASAYMNAVYGGGGFPMLGTYDVAKAVSARSVVGNTGALTGLPAGWAAQIASTGIDQGNAIATDTSGNVFVAGYYSAALTLYNTGGATGATLTNASATQDAFIAKYTSAGAVSWAAQIAGTGNDLGNGIATDLSGNVFVTGQYGAAVTFYNTGGTTGATLAFAGGTSDAFIAKYTSAGAVSWAAQIASTNGDIGYGIATDSSGNVFVTGYYSSGAVTLYNTGGATGATLTNAGVQDAYIAKYTSAGAVSWATRIAGTGGDQGLGIATDTSGNVFVTGFYSAATTLYNTGGATGATLTNAGGNDVFIAKYTSAGAVSWATRIASTGGDIGYGIATDTSGNVFVAGYYSAALTLYNTGGATGATLTNASATQDAFIAKYTSAGAVSWAAQIAGTGNDLGYGIATDLSGNVFVIGAYTSGTLTLYNTGGTTGSTLTNAGLTSVFIAKYTSAGVVSWATQIGGTSGNGVGYGIATDTNGNVFVTGRYDAATTLYNTGGTTGATLTNAGGNDVFIAKYSPTGYITGPLPASSNVLLSATYTPSTFSPFVNGNAATTLAGTTLTATGLFLGGPSNYFNGSISEVLVYGSTLTSAQRQSIEGYLNKKWGVTLSNVHPFFTRPPMNRTFAPTDIPGASLWLDAADPTTMNSTTTVTIWNDKSGLSNTMTGTATLSGSNMTFNGSTQAFSNTTYVFPSSNYSMFAVYSNTTAPASTAYMNAVYGAGGFPMLGVYGDPGGWTLRRNAGATENWGAIASDYSGSILAAALNSSTVGYIYVSSNTGVSWAALSTSVSSSGWSQISFTPDGTRLFAVSGGGVPYVFTVPGGSFTTIGISSTSYTGIACDSTGSNTVYARYGGNIVTATFNGTSWTPTSHTPSGIFGNVAMSSSGSNAIVTVQDAAFVYAGVRTGSTWVWTSRGTFGDTGRIYCASDASGSNLAVTGNPYIWTSRDAGVTWASNLAAGSNNGWSSIASSASGSNLVASTTSNILLGSFNGSTWTWSISSGSASLGQTYVASSSNGSNLYAANRGNAGGLYTGLVPMRTVAARSVVANTSFLVPRTAPSSNVLVTATYTPSTFSPFVNGTTATTLAGTTLAATGIFVGGPSNYFNGSISEVIIYGSTLTAGQRQQVEGYLSQKWNLRSQIVAGHQYKVIPPATPQPPQYSQVTQGNWNYDWQPYLKSLAAANATGVSVTTSNLTGGATFGATGGKWYGGVFAPDGNIYFGPYNSANILKLTVATGVTTNITGGATYTSSGWWGGVLGPDGNIYFPPYSAANILKLTVSTGVTTNITGGATYTLNGWNGGVLGSDGNLYCAPYTATNILKLTVSTGVTTNITGGATFTANGWYGGALGPDGNIYFAPFSATNILKLNPFTGVTTNITGGATFAGFGWSGGVLGPDGNIYFAPYNATNILRLNVSTGVTSNITGGATYTTNGWYGGALGPDGNIYFTPFGATNILKLTISTGVTTNITGAATFTAFGWGGGVLGPDGSIYSSPSTAPNILKLTFSGLSQLPTSNYCLSAYANKF